ncbi:TetR/AcrR family transcriptional regulator [Nonomuraea sediminis]|uniref:TetR/AcrR family transcriptional regulator n=1 Tax=Nonomuraea sediminis TaxID=2835864 RepID=UPI001BDC1F4B|nr:TetR/AcrR family transcriptional regulator [Nonomuraea sediminis]
MGARREQTSRESRDLILAAAAELFAEKGYRQTTFADVAERSQISRGSIPWHFGSKEGLLLAVLEHSVEQLNDRMHEDSAGLDEMLDGAMGYLRLPISKLFVTLLVEALEPDSPIHDRYVAIQDALRERIRVWAEQRPLPEGVTADALSVAVMGALIGIHQQWRLSPDKIDLGEAFGALRVLLR